MPTVNTWGNQVLNADVTINGGTVSIGTDATSGAINIGTGAAARTTTLGNVTGATAVNVNTGTGGSAITTTNGTFAISTGTGSINVGTDAVAKTITIGNATGATSVVVNCGTGALDIGANAIARTTTIGNTTGASVLALKTGTGDFTLASATGTLISALDTGEVTKPLQPAFLVRLSASVTNVTGDATFYTIAFNTEIVDQNADFNTGTYTFTAPVTGVYSFSLYVEGTGLVAGTNTSNYIEVNTSNRLYTSNYVNANSSNTGRMGLVLSALADMDAGDTATGDFRSSGGAKVVGATGGNGFTTFSGYLAC